jgi:hypothetical protein
MKDVRAFLQPALGEWSRGYWLPCVREINDAGFFTVTPLGGPPLSWDQAEVTAVTTAWHMRRVGATSR